MKISTKGRYALRMMIEFGLNPTSTTKINQVAKKQHISEKYLEQIASTLVKGKFITSVRGAQGGYMLAKAPKEYTVGDILRLTEGSLAPVYCLESNSERHQLLPMRLIHYGRARNLTKAAQNPSILIWTCRIKRSRTGGYAKTGISAK